MQTIEITDIELAMSLPQVLADCLAFANSTRARRVQIVPAPRNHGVLEWDILCEGDGETAMYRTHRYIQRRPVDRGRIVEHE